MSAWWHFDRLYTDSFSASDIDYSGRFVWAVSGTSVRIYDVYDLEQWIDQDLIDSYLIEEPNRDLTIFATHTLPGSGHYLTCGNLRAYVSNGSTYQTIYEVLLDGTVNEIPTPSVQTGTTTNECTGDTTPVMTQMTMRSNIHLYNEKLWMVSDDTFDDEHKLFSYDLNTETWDSVIIPVRKQLSVPFYVHDDKAGNVVVTNFNNLSVSLFDAYTNTYVDTVRLDDGTGANRGPYRIFTASDLTTYVASINGMVSIIVPGSPITVDHEYNSLGTADGMTFDGTYLWFASGELVREAVADNDVRMTNGDEDDYSFNTDRFPSTGFSGLTKTIAHSYPTPSGTQNVGEYIFLKTGSHIIAFRNDDRYYRTPYTVIRGVGMVSSGKHDYTGD